MADYDSVPYANPDGISIVRPKVYGQYSVIRQDISRYGNSTIGLQINGNGNLTDADTGSMGVTVYQRTDFTPTADPLGDPTDIDPTTINHISTGTYEFILGPDFTQERSYIAVNWHYLVQGVAYEYWDYFQVVDPMPTYDSFNEGERGIVSQVSWMFSDLFDSVEGGPHLKEEYQTRFGTESIARCVVLAANRINITSQPYTNYVVGGSGGKRFPEANYSVLSFGAYLEVVRHLIRSYTEQPNLAGSAGGVGYLDRRDYTDRWRAILQDEAEDFSKAVLSFKRSLLGLGGGAVLVAGGIFQTSSYFRSGSYSMATRAGRFYPVSWVSVRPS